MPCPCRFTVNDFVIWANGLWSVAHGGLAGPLRIHLCTFSSFQEGPVQPFDVERAL